jgi:lysophospholipase L1-like esterase
MITRNVLLAACLFQLVLATGSAGAADDIAILAAGDSITQGGKSFRCYREFLVPELADSHPDVRFVGPNKDNPSAHCGFGGRDASFLNSIIRKVYTKHPADIVLRHSGHNCFGENKPVPGIIAATEQMIETMHSLNPDVTVLLAQVIPAGKLPKYSYIPELNEKLRQSAERMKAKGLNVVLVNQAEGFDWRSDTVGDKVHPNEAGARKMAAKWMEALKAVLPKREAAAAK